MRAFLKTVGLLSLVAIFASELPYADSASAQVQFKRVKPPAPGTRKRITIQATGNWPPPLSQKKTPEVKPTAGPSLEASDTSQPAKKPDAWFWDVISPRITEADPRRIETALLHVNTRPGGLAAFGVDPARIERVAAEHGLEILKATLSTSLSPAFVLAVIEAESGGKVTAQSNKGAQGLMQLIPATAERFGVKDVHDPLQNITGGVKYLDWLLRRFQGDPLLALAGYNAGENAVTKAGGVPNYPETRHYIPKIVAAWGHARQLCITPPRQVRDGCVLKSSKVSQ